MAYWKATDFRLKVMISSVRDLNSDDPSAFTSFISSSHRRPVYDENRQCKVRRGLPSSFLKEIFILDMFKPILFTIFVL